MLDSPFDFDLFCEVAKISRDLEESLFDVFGSGRSVTKDSLPFKLRRNSVLLLLTST